jgi:hypothetical protein
MGQDITHSMAQPSRNMASTSLSRRVGDSTFRAFSRVDFALAKSHFTMLVKH